MSHSRILQLSTEPIDQEELLHDWDLYEGSFIGEVADYVIDSDAEADIREWFIPGMKDVLSFDLTNKTVTIQSKDKFLRPMYEQFSKELTQMKEGLTYEKYADPRLCGLSMEMFSLSSLYDDKFGFYVYTEGELLTMTEFLRGAQDGEVYHYGNTLDFHY